MARRKAALPATEHQVQAAILEFLAVHPLVAWAHRMNTGAVAYQPAAPGGKRRFLRFGFVGCPDILGMLKGGRALAIEVKRPGGRLTAAQGDFISQVSNNGGLALVAHSVEEVEAALNTPVLNGVHSMSTDNSITEIMAWLDKEIESLNEALGAPVAENAMTVLLETGKCMGRREALHDVYRELMKIKLGGAE